MRKKIKDFSIKVLKDVSGTSIIDNNIWLYYANVYVCLWFCLPNDCKLVIEIICNVYCCVMHFFWVNLSRLMWQTPSILIKKNIHCITAICCFVATSVAVERWKCRTLRYCLVLYLGFGSWKTDNGNY